ncbi:MAG: HNH endonuclease [Victivallaceae bacterium]|nr:HNH endonuclease [Victivallaceae bacterium]MDD4180800.1 HNH endonuclease [Victivallaceae bacterium]
MPDWIEINKDPKHIAHERQKAREMRSTQWWLAQLQKGICHYCGEKFPSDQLTMDHIVPVSRGGRSNKANIVPCCKECNNDKKYLTPAELILRRLENEENNER